ncbi:MAG TPA: branched-chain amino acid ABC transporter permease [Acidimicrobiia bacterium]|nr:branched-chain amino acid ABC transporter permease [Acidimicrobiia bacterium]
MIDLSALIATVSLERIAQGAIDAISVGSLYALFSLGIALIFGIMGLMNFAHGELIMVGAYVLVLGKDLRLVALLAICVGSVMLVALLLERVAFRPVRAASPATLLVTSFAISFLLQNVVIQAVGSVPMVTNLSTTLSESFAVGSLSIPKLNVITVGVTAVLLTALILFLEQTSLGVQMRASAEDFLMARLLGVKANRVIAVAFALSGLLAAVAAILIIGRTGSATPTMGLYPVLYAFIATILGGVGSLPGAVLGGYVLGALTVALQIGLPVELQPFRDALMFGIVFAVLVWRPQGLIHARSMQTRI